MTEPVAAVILDGLDIIDLKQLPMPNLERLYTERQADILGVSTMPHTALSNPMIWGGYRNEDKFWVKEPEHEWTDPALGFDRSAGRAKGEAERTWNREDFETSFVWDDLDQAGFEASAVHVPIVLPPYNFNTVEGYEMGDWWFPDTPERMDRHMERMPEEIIRHAEAGRDFIAASIQFPDKWMHALATGEIDGGELNEAAMEFDRSVAGLVEELESHGYEWMLFGDHGRPTQGAMILHDVRQLLPRHRNESVIVSSMEDHPTYTHGIAPFLRDHYGVEQADFESLELPGAETSEEEEVKRRLENLGYRGESDEAAIEERMEGGAGNGSTTVGAYIVTRNGLSARLERAVATVDRMADHILVSVAESSDDGTLDWCRADSRIDTVLTDDIEWAREEPELRRRCYERLKEEVPGLDWVAAIDDDEVLPEPGAARATLEAQPDTVEMVTATMYHLWEGYSVRGDGRWRPGFLPYTFFQNLNADPGGSFGDTGPHCRRLPRDGDQPTMAGAVPVLHCGWQDMTDSERRRKVLERNGAASAEEIELEAEREILKSLRREPVLKQIPERWRKVLEGDEVTEGG